MICKVCGFHNEAGAEFCGQCGTPFLEPRWGGEAAADGTAASEPTHSRARRPRSTAAAPDPLERPRPRREGVRGVDDGPRPPRGTVVGDPRLGGREPSAPAPGTDRLLESARRVRSAAKADATGEDVLPALRSRHASAARRRQSGRNRASSAPGPAPARGSGVGMGPIIPGGALRRRGPLAGIPPSCPGSSAGAPAPSGEARLATASPPRAPRRPLRRLLRVRRRHPVRHLPSESKPPAPSPSAVVLDPATDRRRGQGGDRQLPQGLRRRLPGRGRRLPPRSPRPGSSSVFTPHRPAELDQVALPGPIPRTTVGVGDRAGRLHVSVP